jgi:hypothetical protein
MSAIPVMAELVSKKPGKFGSIFLLEWTQVHVSSCLEKGSMEAMEDLTGIYI